MSSEAMAIVLRAQIEDPAAKAVLIGLAEHAGPDGRHTYPSVPRLAVYTSLGESTVRRKLADLRAEGLIELVSEASHHRPTEYSLNLWRLQELKHPLIDELERRARVASGASMTATSGGGLTSRSERAETSQSERPEAETSRSEQETSRSRNSDLPLRAPNQVLNRQLTAEEERRRLEQLGDQLLAGIIRDQFGGSPSQAVRSQGFQRVFARLRVLEQQGDQVTLAHPQPELFDEGYLRILRSGLAGALGHAVIIQLQEAEA
jgi:hypothetical protein